MAKIAMPLAADFEDSEYAVPRARLCAAGHEITVIGSNGTVLADNWANPATMENHANRPEILRAAIRNSQSVGPFSRAIDAAVRSAHYAARAVVRLESPPIESPPIEGWCSDYPFGRPLIESWTSATVLQMALSLHEVIGELNSLDALASFPRPDLGSVPSWLVWSRFKVASEPDSEVRILDYIERHILDPIQRNPRTLPTAGDRSVSLLLFGPPGTSKTTICRALAVELKWPLLVLSPGSFIARGLEYIEAESQSVFSRLLRLSRVVVLFDECDELFRERTPAEGMEQMRGIAAFDGNDEQLSDPFGRREF